MKRRTFFAASLSVFIKLSECLSVNKALLSFYLYSNFKFIGSYQEKKEKESAKTEKKVARLSLIIFSF